MGEKITDKIFVSTCQVSVGGVLHTGPVVGVGWRAIITWVKRCEQSRLSQCVRQHRIGGLVEDVPSQAHKLINSACRSSARAHAARLPLIPDLIGGDKANRLGYITPTSVKLPVSV